MNSLPPPTPQYSGKVLTYNARIYCICVLLFKLKHYQIKDIIKKINNLKVSKRYSVVATFLSGKKRGRERGRGEGERHYSYTNLSVPCFLTASHCWLLGAPAISHCWSQQFTHALNGDIRGLMLLATVCPELHCKIYSVKIYTMVVVTLINTEDTES